MPFFVKQGDQKPALQATLEQPLGSAANLALATVVLHMRHASALASLSAVASIVTASAGLVAYAWSATDTAVAGEYGAEFQVTFSDGTPLTFPNDSNFSVVIASQIA